MLARAKKKTRCGHRVFNAHAAALNGILRSSMHKSERRVPAYAHPMKQNMSACCVSQGRSVWSHRIWARFPEQNPESRSNRPACESHLKYCTSPIRCNLQEMSPNHEDDTQSSATRFHFFFCLRRAGQRAAAPCYLFVFCALFMQLFVFCVFLTYVEP
jgi:hypothetical protein